MNAIGPLPIGTRVFHGETLDSFARRHALRNHTTVHEVEQNLRVSGLLTTSRGRNHVDRAAAWRALGALSPTAFPTAGRVAGIPIVTRILCDRCTRGEVAYGARPDMGQVCLTHSRWLGVTQVDLYHFPAATRAEWRFRPLTQRGVLFDAPVMQIGRSAAFAGIPRSTLDQRARTLGTSDHDALVYPEQVDVARMLCDQSVMERVTNPTIANSARREVVVGALAHVFSRVPAARIWAAVLAIQPALDRTLDQRREHRALTAVGEEVQFGILRHLELSR